MKPITRYQATSGTYYTTTTYNVTTEYKTEPTHTDTSGDDGQNETTTVSVSAL